MKDLLTILLLLTTFISFGQTCDTMKGKVINCIDNNGQKQGLWENGIYDWRQQENYGPVPGFCQTVPMVRTRIRVTSTGNFFDNKKVGTWKYFADNHHLIYVEREVTYNENGTITEKNLLDRSIIEYNSDSTIITGFIYHNGDTINVACLNKKAVFKLSNDMVILAFDCTDFNRFDYELLRLKVQVYDREIKLAKLKQ